MVLCDLMELGGWRSGPHLVVGIKSKWMGIRKASWEQLQRMRRKSSSVEKSWNLMTLTEGQTRKKTWTLPRRSPWLSRRQQLLESRQQRLWWSAAQVVSCSAASNSAAAASTPWQGGGDLPQEQRWVQDRGGVFQKIWSSLSEADNSLRPTLKIGTHKEAGPTTIVLSILGRFHEAWERNEWG